MKRVISFTLAFALIGGAFAACTQDFDQFKPGGTSTAGAAGSTAGTSGAAGSVAGTSGAAGSTAGAAGGCTAQCCSPADCPAPPQCVQATCDAGTCGTQPAAAGATCNDGGTVCDGAGSCVECNSDMDCSDPTKPGCDTNSHTCVPGSCMDMKKNGDETDVDCGGGTCGACADGKKCSSDTDCLSGVCEGAGANAVCKAPSCTDKVLNGDESDVDCGGSCPIKCENGKMCAGSNSNCQSGLCSNNICTAKSSNGTPCGAGGECSSGNCTDGVCCATQCMQSTCRRCDIQGSEGTCTAIPAGQDPDSECPGATVCDGAGACAKGNGQTCGGGSECASKNCVDGVCCDTACGTACQACDVAGSVGTCTNIPQGTDPHNDCSGALNCDGNGACEKAANGTACANGGECTSGFCADGVCCNAACTGLCKACTMVKSGAPDGTCMNIPAGTDPDNECSMGTNNCDGNGGCI